MDVRTPLPTNGGNLVAKFGEAWKNQVAQLKQKFGGAIEEVRMPPDYPTDVPIIYVNKESIVEILSFMKTDPAFEYNFLVDITATDEMEEPRFEIVYNLLAMGKMTRIRLKTRVREGEEVPTATPVWHGANWPEREVYDMFGVRFKGHPDLRRILMDNRWVGHPLRKDYPLRGYQVFTTPQQADTKLLD